MQILYLALDCPLPANNGLRMRTAAMLSALRAEGCRTTLVCLQATESLSARAQLQHLCEAHWILDHRIPSLSQGQHLLGRVHAAAARLPFAALRFRSAAARTLVQQLWDSAAWDALICDTVFSAINVPACAHGRRRLARARAATWSARRWIGKVSWRSSRARRSLLRRTLRRTLRRLSPRSCPTPEIRSCRNATEAFCSRAHWIGFRIGMRSNTCSPRSGRACGPGTQWRGLKSSAAIHLRHF